MKAKRNALENVLEPFKSVLTIGSMELTINIFCQTSWQSWNILKPSLQFTYFIKHPDNLETLWNQAYNLHILSNILTILKHSETKQADEPQLADCMKSMTPTGPYRDQFWPSCWSQMILKYWIFESVHVLWLQPCPENSFLCYGKTAPAMSRKYWVSARANMHQQHNFWNVKLLEKEDISVKHREFKYASSPLFSSCGQPNLDFLPILPFPSSTSL